MGRGILSDPATQLYARLGFMAWQRRQSDDRSVGSLGEDGLTYIPPTRRKRVIRVRWYAPIAIAAGVVVLVVFLVTGPDYNQRIVLERADGTQHEICAVRTIVGDGGVEPIDGRLPGSNAARHPTWLDANPPSDLAVSPGGRVTYFDEDGRAFVRLNGEPWSSALVEPEPEGPANYVSLEARGAC